MMTPARRYLTLRALGAPAVLLSLAMQGVFRGFKDTKTPLFATGMKPGDLLKDLETMTVAFSFDLVVLGSINSVAPVYNICSHNVKHESDHDLLICYCHCQWWEI